MISYTVSRFSYHMLQTLLSRADREQRPARAWREVLGSPAVGGLPPLSGDGRTAGLCHSQVMCQVEWDSRSLSLYLLARSLRASLPLAT
jgi:hypothetical protein